MSYHNTKSVCTAAEKPEYYEYLLHHVNEPSVLRELRQQSEEMEIPGMMATPDQYQFLAWLCATTGAKRVIEVGVFRGVTTLAVALQLPEDGVIKALDITAENTNVGIEAWKKAGVRSKIDFVVGPADASMKAMIEAGESESYDFVFIDADKSEYPQYYELALQLLRRGGIIAVDNALMGGRVTDPAYQNSPSLKPLMHLNETIRKDDRVSAVMSILSDGVYFVRKL